MLASSFLYCLLNSATFRADVAARLNPTAQPGIYLGTLAAIPMCLPAQPVVAAFDKVASVLFAKMRDNIRVSRKLTDLRNTLLPKLLSGEVPVRQADQLVGEAGV
jgi:type I restriction enzyme S subunit